MKDPKEIQKEYYERTASDYDSLHVKDNDFEHNISLSFLSAMITAFNAQSILDVGAGTGRTMLYFKSQLPEILVKGIEPVFSLRKSAYDKGIQPEDLIEGDGYKIQFPDNSFDIVCEFGILHHVKEPERIIAEMLRVAKVGIFISDSNNFGQGSCMSRKIKQIINAIGLWKAYNYIRTKGKIYQMSDTDGLFYSYSIFNNYSQLKKNCKDIICFNINAKLGYNVYKSSGHAALFGTKKNH